MPNFDSHSPALEVVDKRRNSRVVGVLNGTQTVANQCQINGPNTGYNPVSSVEIGQVVDIVSPTGVVRGSARTITAISGTTTLTVTYGGADIGTDANGDFVVLSEGADTLGNPTNYDSVAALDARLIALGLLTAITAVQRTKNDKMYMLRLADSPGGI